LADSDSLSALEAETLHYHSFLLDFSEQPEALETIEEILTAWLSRFPPGTGQAWEPFTVAYRAQNWLKIHSHLTSAGGKTAGLREKLERSLFAHGLYLERNLEKHLGGNHLMKDLCALAMLSGFFEGPTADRWFRIVESELPRQLEIQILPDGGHYERSPMYHDLVLVDLVDAAERVEVRDGAWVEKELTPVLDRMFSFLEGITHGDGEVPFFNDSVFGQAPPPQSVLKGPLSAGDSFNTFPDSGFTRMRRGGITLLFDHGRLGPDELMGHVHDDALSFEVSVGEERFIANRGVYEYTAGEKRNESRSIRSHNTPCVDGLEQSEIWGSFRVARRWHVDRSTSKEENGEWVAQGSWSRPGMPRISRTVRSSPDGTFRIEDRIEGSGVHTVEIPFRFATGVTLNIEEEEEDEGKSWTWEAKSGAQSLSGRIRASAKGNLDLTQSTWWPRFNVEAPATVLKLMLQADCPVQVDTNLRLSR
jgi:hypothetical protein